MKKVIIILINILAIFLAVELLVNYFAIKHLFAIKLDNKYGYVCRKNFEFVVPLGKYDKRIYSQLALPFELLNYKFNKKELVAFKGEKDLFGYKYKNNGKIAIEDKFLSAQDFSHGYAIVSIEKEGKKLYGTIDKQGNWLIQPKYSHICGSKIFYIKACYNEKSCGVIDMYGLEVVKFVYDLEKIDDHIHSVFENFCAININNKYSYCN